MKTTLKIVLLAVALAVMTGCSAQRRAERHMRKAVALCPELVQLKAHPIDTVLTAPGWADCAFLPIGEVMTGSTLYAATDHGTVVVRLRTTDSLLRVGFVAAPQQVRYQDTVRYRQVSASPGALVEPRSVRIWRAAGLILLGVVVGIVALFVIALRAKLTE